MTKLLALYEKRYPVQLSTGYNYEEVKEYCFNMAWEKLPDGLSADSLIPAEAFRYESDGGVPGNENYPQNTHSEPTNTMA